MEQIRQAKEKLPLPALMETLGLEGHAKKSARCPWHDDHQNSFSVWHNEHGWHFKCHAGCGSGDEISFLEKHFGISRKDAIARYLETAGINGAQPPRSKPNEHRGNVS